jgi:hypothetical protein
MIDKLELRIPETVWRRDRNWAKYRSHPNWGSPYATTLDALDSLKLSVHYNFRPRVANDKMHSKVDFTSVGLMSADDFMWRLQHLFLIEREEALSLHVLRIDLAADVCGVDVEWFKANSHVRMKRNSRT